MPAETQKAAFQALLEDSVAEDLSFDVVQNVHAEVAELIERQKQDKEIPAPTVTKTDIRRALADSGVPEEKLVAFDERYDEQFGPAVDLGAKNIVEPKKLELRTPDVVIHVNPERSDLVETRVIDGMKYILIRADDNVQVNGISISIQE